MEHDEKAVGNALTKFYNAKFLLINLIYLRKSNVLHSNFNAIKIMCQKFERKERVKRNIYKNLIELYILIRE